jgi:hypothetical protein
MAAGWWNRSVEYETFEFVLTSPSCETEVIGVGGGAYSQCEMLRRSETEATKTRRSTARLVAREGPDKFLNMSDFQRLRRKDKVSRAKGDLSACRRRQSAWAGAGSIFVDVATRWLVTENE